MSIDIISLPFIGAFIGYFTNYVAIKMLFYPKKPYYVGNLRIPFTPGLIPKKRNELVDKISNVVAEKVINKKELIKYIYSKHNRDFLYSYSKQILDNLLEKKITELKLPYRKIQSIISGELNRFVDLFLKEKLEKFNIDIDYITYNAFLMIDKNKKIKDFLNKDQIKLINQNIEILVIKSLNNLSESLDDNQTKELIKNKITESLNDYIDSSNILTASFVSMIAPLIEENEKIMDIIIDKLKKFLNDKKIQKRVNDSIKDSIEKEILNISLDEFLIKFTNGNLDNIRIKTAQKLKEIVDKLNIKEKFIEEILKAINTENLPRKGAAYLRLMLSKYTFRDVLQLIKPGFDKKLNRYIVNNLLIIVRKESQRIFDFDIAKNARKKLESLDIGQIEDIILNISKEQFKYINLFGGLLGFIIGIIEVILR